MSIDFILGRQNPDGGWPYVRGKSWIEPSVYAVMALWNAGEKESAQRGIEWIRSMQRSDGGWPPQADVDQSTWVTGLVAMLPPELLGAGAYRRSIEWLTSTSGQESSTTHRLRLWLMGRKFSEKDFEAWPWMPGAAAWVSPTCIAVLALDKAQQRMPSPEILRRMQQGREFLLSRVCLEGGWNHGSSYTLGVHAPAYPETTGIALAALHGVTGEKVQRSLRAADGFLKSCQSADALNWLRLGLLAHNRLPESFLSPPDIKRRTVPEASLDLMVGQIQRGQNPLWGQMHA